MQQGPASLVAHDSHASSLVTKEDLLLIQGGACAPEASAELLGEFHQGSEVGVGDPWETKPSIGRLEGEDDSGFLTREEDAAECPSKEFVGDGGVFGWEEDVAARPGCLVPKACCS